MSEYVKGEAVKVTDEALFVKCLEDEFGVGSVEVHAQPRRLYGYHGDLRDDTAHIIVKREAVGHAANDVGFRRLGNGKLEPVISQFDRRAYDMKAGIARVQHATVNYAEKLVRKNYAGYRIERQVLTNGTVKLKVGRG